MAVRHKCFISYHSADKNVVDKFIIELEAQLEDKGVLLEVQPDAKAWLAENGFDANMGARPMARVIRESIKKPLAESLLFGELKGGGKVIVKLDDDGHLMLECKSKQDNEKVVPA